MEDLERLRQPWEPNEHWAMRREFIRRHRNRFPENRLLCLAQTFVNMELLGCAYPARVAEFVRELAKDLPRSERAKAPAVAPVAFVRASDPSPKEASLEVTAGSYTALPDRQQFVGGYANRAGLGCKPREQPAGGDDSLDPSNAVPPRQQFVGGFANRAGLGFESRKRSSDNSDCLDYASAAKLARKPTDKPSGKSAPAPPEGSPPPVDSKDSTRLPKFQAAAQMIRDDVISGPNTLDKLQQVFSKCGFSLDVQFEQQPAQKQKPLTFECVVCADGETLGKASASSKKEAKRLAFQVIWDGFSRVPESPKTPIRVPAPPRKFEQSGNRLNAGKQQTSPEKVCTQQNLTGDDGMLDLETLVVVQALNSSCDAMSTLSRTACANRLRGTFEVESAESGFKCTYILGNCEIKHGVGETKQEAKLEAASASLAYLQSVAPTLRMKRRVDGHGPELTKNTFGTPGESSAQGQIASENIGHKLLKMMGWSGGGIGKEGLGIVEPVMLKETCGRNGLGFSGGPARMNSNFKTKVHQVLKEFADTVVLQDLVFSPEFDNEERKYVHSVARRYGLKSVSVDGPSGRFLTVRHKLSVRQLVDTILASGPTEKYEVVMPALQNSDEES
ncbi:NF-kappa-B-repressing factor-like [Dermacentor albipictus]|uniref:NF-kappa-B-repressing factor-like n=1 Tax=Dermacentor albipictus TaxID=60249 RepID=UPI0038FD38A8